MSMKGLLDILSDFIYFHKKWIIITIIILILAGGYYLTDNNTFKTILFYPDKSMQYLLAENRTVIKAGSKRQALINCIDELLLGPMDPQLKNYFPNDAKLDSVRLEEDTIHLNFNKELVMSADFELTNPNIHLYLQSIVHSVCYLAKEIKVVKFYFKGNDYHYIGNFGPMDEGITADWSILKK